MIIEITEKNRYILSNAISNTIEVIKRFSESEEKLQSDKKKLVLYDLLMRQYPNLNSINLLFGQYFTLHNLGNTLPIGLIMRCSIEDMMYAKYLLTFVENPIVFEKEIVVQSRNAVSEYIDFFFKNEPEFWSLSEDKKKELMLERETHYETFKKENKQFFDEHGKIISFGNLRKDIPNIRKYFDSKSIEKHGPSNLFKRLKNVEPEFSYIYFEYKFYCLYEHYSFPTRNILELNEYTFGHLALSFEFILWAVNDILIYLNVNKEYLLNIKEINKSLAGLIIKE